MDQYPIDPALFDGADVRVVLARRNIGALYRALKDAGISQRRIAALTGQSQSPARACAAGLMPRRERARVVSAGCD